MSISLESDLVIMAEIPNLFCEGILLSWKLYPVKFYSCGLAGGAFLVLLN